MIIKLKRSDWDKGNTNTTIANAVKKKLNGETPREMRGETVSIGEEIEINVKL